MARAIDGYARAGEMELCNQADLDFHLYIMKHSGSPILITFLENFSVITTILLNSVWFQSRKEDYLETVGVHDPVIDAINSGDPEAAERAGREHVRSPLERVIERAKTPSKIELKDTHPNPGPQKKYREGLSPRTNGGPGRS
jgi:DNA-binding FadR family transcriptional regulator